MNTAIPYKDLIDMVSFYCDIGVKYIYERAGSSVLLKVNGITYYSSSIENPKDRLPVKQIYFIAKVKKHILKHNLCKKISPNYKNEDLIKYFHYNKKIKVGENLKNTYSIDIEKAYWVSALQQGFITNELYQEGLKVDKKIRISCLGTFAKQKHIYHFNGKNEIYDGCTMPQYPHVFFNQANAIYGIMEKCRRAIGDKHLFYWTDGIYVKGKQAAEICEKTIADFGFGYTTTELVNIERSDVGFIVSEYAGKKLKKKHYKTNTD